MSTWTRPHQDTSEPVQTEAARRPDAADLLTVQEAADLAQVARKTVDRRVRSSRLASWDGERGGKSVRLVSRLDVLESWPREGQEATDDQTVPSRPDVSEPVSGRSDAAVETSTAPIVGGEPTSAIVSVVEVGIEELGELRAAAARVPDLEARATGAEGRESKAVKRAEVEHGERQLILSRLLDADAKVLQLEGTDAPAAKADRRLVYAVAGIALLGICGIGWRLVVADAMTVTTAGERDAAAHRASVAEGSVETLRETLRDERDRSSTLERDLADSEKTIETGERAARAMGEVLVQMFKGE